jgi:outer membrane protein assembly factor BamE
MKTLLISTLLAVVLAGCSSWNPLSYVHPYRMDIQQGNLVTQEMLSQLKPGMSPSQVRFVLGTPLIVDPFHKERWDYIYLLEKNDKIVERRHITVLFENDKFKGLEGDIKPAAAKAPVDDKPASDKPAAAPAEAKP